MSKQAFVDVHNHCTEFSPDASQPLSDRIREAKEQGLAGIVMTDHFDKDLYEVRRGLFLDPKGPVPKDGEWIFYVPDYMKRMKAEREKLASAGDPFKLLIGIELGYAPLLSELFRDMVKVYKDDLDCIIASMHSMEYQDVYEYQEHIFSKDKKHVYALYINYMSEMLEDMEYANVLGHFDYISRYSRYVPKKMFYRDFADEFDRLFEIMIRREVALELNIGSQRAKELNGDKMGLPDPEILLRYKEMGGRLIALGSDAHHKKYVGRGFSESADYLIGLGFTHLTHFEKQKPVLTPLR